MIFDLETTREPTMTVQSVGMHFIISAPGGARRSWTARGRFLKASAWNKPFEFFMTSR
jgi:hypothetical protein